jgi:hypothetical protein
MAIQKKNLLEAFQASAAAEKAKAAAGAAAGQPKAGGPFAQPTPAKPPAEPAGDAPGESPLRRAWSQRAWNTEALMKGGLQRLIVLQLLITIAAFFLGRASVSSVDAGDGSARGDEVAAGLQQPPPASGAGATPSPQPGDPSGAQQSGGAAQVVTQPGTPAERALLDPRNLYTVKVVEYRKGKDDEVALSTLEYFLDQGLPAVAQVQGGRLFILLGAAPTQAELDELLAEAKTMRGPPPLSKPAEFHDAYVVGIDRLGIR